MPSACRIVTPISQDTRRAEARGHRTTVRAFLRDNRGGLSRGEIRAVRAGRTVFIGGGAWGAFRVSACRAKRRN